MKGQYHMMDWEEAKWKQAVSAAIFKLTYDKTYIADFTKEDVCPANLCRTLKNLGWNSVDIDRNGWENDTWHTFSHPDYNFYVIIHYEGYTFKLDMYSSETEL